MDSSYKCIIILSMHENNVPSEVTDSKTLLIITRILLTFASSTVYMALIDYHFRFDCYTSCCAKIS